MSLGAFLMSRTELHGSADLSLFRSALVLMSCVLLGDTP
jgi:hypothetical protein